MKLNECTVLQIAKIYQVHKLSHLKVLKLSVQQQNGMLDCGLFAIANAVEVCYGKNPESTIYKQKEMRQHLFRCFNEGLLSPFPKGDDSSDVLPRPQRFLLTINIYCLCRMPEIYDSAMIDCDRCHEWFHFRCVGLDENNVPRSWVCTHCM